MARPSPTVRRRRLRAELRRLRTERGLTIDAVQELSKGDIKTPNLSRWETGERNVRPTDVRLLLDIYEVGGEEREALLTLARQAKERGWWQSYGTAVPSWFQFYVGLESEASAIREYSAELVPGLLQTADYYRAFLGTAPGDPRITGKEVDVRTARQERLTSDDDPPELWVVLNEAVIRRNVGGSAVMRAQLEHLAELAALPRVTIQVLPFGAGVHPAMDGSPVACTWKNRPTSTVSRGCSVTSSRRRSARRTRGGCSAVSRGTSSSNDDLRGHDPQGGTGWR